MNSLLAYVNASDFRVNDRLTAWRPPRWLHLWMIAATRLGDGWLWLLAEPALLGPGDRARDALATLALAAASANGFLVVLKRGIRRPRPDQGWPTSRFAARQRPQFASDVFSFPSGHSLNAFAAGTVVALGSPGLAPIAFVVAASVAASRVFLGFHYLTDVLAGAALGLLIGAGAFQVAFR